MTWTYLIAITPGVIFVSNVLVRVFYPLFQRWHVLPVFPMLIPQVVGIDAGEKDDGHDSVDGKFSPQVTGSCSMSFYSSSFTVKGIVREWGKLLLGAIESTLENPRPDGRRTGRGDTSSLGQAKNGNTREHNV